MRPALEYARRLARFQRNARLYLINNALSGVTAGIVLVLYNLYLYSLGYRADFVGLVLFTVTIGAGIAICPAGLCIDRVSGKTILLLSNLLIAVAGIGQFLFRQPVPLLVSSFVEGVAFAFILVINAPFLTRNSSPRERPDLFSMNISLGLITLVVGEVVGGALPIWFRSLSWLMAPLPMWAARILASQPDPRSYQLSLLFAGLIAAPSLIPLFLLRNDLPPVSELAQSRRGGGGWAGCGGACAARVPSPCRIEKLLGDGRRKRHHPSTHPSPPLRNEGRTIWKMGSGMSWNEGSRRARRKNGGRPQGSPPIPTAPPPLQ